MMTRIKILVMIVMGALPFVCAQGQTSTTRPLTAGEEMELKTLAAQLSDPARDSKTKLDAASLLLARSYPQAWAALKEFLADNANRPAQIAVAEAIARNGTDERSYIEPLLKMLSGAEASVRDPAARALASYKNGAAADRLIEIAADKARDRAVRLVTINAMQRILDKKVLDTLVSLLDDGDTNVRSAATDALVSMTNIRAFGANRFQWKEWWRQNKNKDRSQWLADLADSLGQSKAALEVDNSRLRTRLAKAMIDLYAATPASQRDAMVISLLKDQLEDVRLVGLELLNRSLDGGSQISPEIQAQVRSMLADSDSHVRQESALLIASMGDSEATKVLLDRLKIETAPPVRQGIMMALGQLRDVKALGVVLTELNTSKDDDVAAAAAIALGKIATKQQIDEATRKNAVSALIDRFKLTAQNNGDSSLREALAAAMGNVNDKAFLALLDGALGDEAATVRLAAINSLSQLAAVDSAPKIEKLVGDGDRGVRGSALAALRTLGGERYLHVILQRTEASAEDDAANRAQAWSLAMGILDKSDVKVLADVVDKLAKRTDAAVEGIKIMQMYVGKLRDAKSPDLPATLRQVGRMLVKNARQAEAAAYLAEAHDLLLAAKSPQAGEVWLELVDSLLAADDPAAIKAIADQSDAALFSKALKSFDARLDELKKKSAWQSIVVLADECSKRLPTRLSADQQETYKGILQQAKTQQDGADRQRVGKLAVQLVGSDLAAQKAATAELQAMGDRAIAPLLEELKAQVESEKPNPASEQVLLEVIRLLAPKLTGYDPGSAKAERLKLIASWQSGR